MCVWWYLVSPQDEGSDAVGVKVLEVADSAKQVHRNHGNRIKSCYHFRTQFMLTSYTICMYVTDITVVPLPVDVSGI